MIGFWLDVYRKRDVVAVVVVVDDDDDARAATPQLPSWDETGTQRERDRQIEKKGKIEWNKKKKKKEVIIFS